MEIERKFLLKSIPFDLESFPSHPIEQAYLCTDPVIRIRRQGERFILTCKGKGMMSREECNLPMPEASYRSLLPKAEGNVITKRRYLIPLPGNCGLDPALAASLIIELDVFSGRWDGLVVAEVEFPDEKSARQFTPPDWFGDDVTFDGHYHNAYLSRPDAVLSRAEQIL